MSEREYKPRRAVQESEKRPRTVTTQRAKADRESRRPERPVNDRPKKKKRKPVNRNPLAAGIAIVAAMLVLCVAFGAFVVKTQLLPMKYLLVMFGVLFLLVILVALLVCNRTNRARFNAGIIVSLFIAALLLLASFFIARGVRTLNNISGTKTEIAHVGIYVTSDDPAQKLEDVEEYNFGILGVLDRANVDDSIDQINKLLGSEIAIDEYGGLTELVEGLFSGEVGAVILNSAYLDVIADMEGYEDIRSRIREITNLKVETQVTITEPVEEDHVFTIYLSGIDSRNGLVAKSRSDVNILATVNTETRQVLLLSTPRDYYVPLPISNGVPDKLTHAGIYGVDVSIGTLEMLYDVEIDYYFRVNFEGFEDIVDALGGITVYSDHSFKSSVSNKEIGRNISFDKGKNYLDGQEALYFARERKNLADGDNQRGRNQMAVIKGIINKVISPEILLSYTSVLDAVEGSFEMSVPYDLIATVVRDQLDKGGDWNIVSYAVSGTGASKVPYSMSQKAYVTIPDESTVALAQQMMQQVANDEVITEPEK